MASWDIDKIGNILETVSFKIICKSHFEMSHFKDKLIITFIYNQQVYIESTVTSVNPTVLKIQGGSLEEKV